MKLTLEQIASVILAGADDIQVEILDRNCNSIEFFNYSNIKKFEENKYKIVDVIDIENKVVTIWDNYNE